MYKLRVLRDSKEEILEFEGSIKLSELLARAGYAVGQPCGGRGVCQKCAVELSGAVSGPNEAEQRAGARLLCQAILLGDAEVRLAGEQALAQIELGGRVLAERLNPMPGRLGAAVDIGTTSVALKLFDLSTGACLADAGIRNPQTAVAADVMGRIGAAMEGRLNELQQQIREAIHRLLMAACGDADRAAEHVDAMVITGNTTMLYLLTGRNPESLSHAPFEADCLFDRLLEKDGRSVCLPPCMNAFVGADISCAVLSAAQCKKEETSLLADIGTNGELALWKDGTLYVTSTAAGPAFEGAGISCGCSSMRGAIDRVWLEDGCIRTHTIGDDPACGLCGSGLIDAIACFLENGEIDETGATDAEELCLRDGIALQPKDVRAVQLAKAAIAAGIETLMETANVTADEIAALYIAGGFGRHLNVESAARIGLIPGKLKARVHVLGNAALSGAAMLLLDRETHAEIRRIAACAHHVNLGGNPAFNEHYMDQIFFPEE